MNNIYLIVGPSGCGKTKVSEALHNRYGMKTVWSYTTRPKRFENEPGHVFVSDEEFDALGSMCAYTEYNGYRYGVTEDIIEKNDIYVIDPPGVRYMLEHYEGKKKVFIIGLEVSETIRAFRMMKRGDTIEDILNRLQYDTHVFNNKTYIVPYDQMISETDFESIVTILKYWIDVFEKGEIEPYSKLMR